MAVYEDGPAVLAVTGDIRDVEAAIDLDATPKSPARPVKSGTVRWTRTTSRWLPASVARRVPRRLGHLGGLSRPPILQPGRQLRVGRRLAAEARLYGDALLQHQDGEVLRRGQLRIHFHSEEELMRLFDVLIERGENR